MRQLLTTLLVPIALVALLPLSAQARQADADSPLFVAVDDGSGQIGQDLGVFQGNGKSLSQAVAQVKRQYKNGRIISAETKRQGNREVHHIKVLTQDNKVRTVKVQGRTLS